MVLSTNLKHYKDMLWLLYKYANLNLPNNFDEQINLQTILNERGPQQGNPQDLVKDLESLGPFYVKLGQVLGAELDLLPPAYDDALQNLQDKATPMPYEDVLEVFFEEFGESPDNIFAHFSHEPISAASLGQVHIAKLPDGKDVAVKVQRRDVQQQILEQLEALQRITELLEEKTEWGKRYHVIEKFDYLRTTLLNELDYIKEANNLIRLSKNLKEFENLLIPKPFGEYTTPRILTMDYIKGEKITDLSPLKKIETDGKTLALDLLKAFFKQILVNGFFQLDPHPGNIYLTDRNKKPCLVIFDLGMVGQIPFDIQGKLIQCLFAMSEGREEETSNIMISAGSKLPQFDEYLFRSKISKVISDYRGMYLNEVPLGKLILHLSRTAADAGLWLPVQFSLIGKTFLSLHAVLKSLDPQLDLSQIFREHAFELMNQRFSSQFTYQSFYGTLLEGTEFLRKLPSKLNQIMDLVLKNDFQLKVHFHEHEPIAKNFEKIANRITMGILLASLVIAAALIMRIDTSYRLFGYPGLAISLLLLAAAGSFLLILHILWNDRERK